MFLSGRMACAVAQGLGRAVCLEQGVRGKNVCEINWKEGTALGDSMWRMCV
jgi:hypothetical protein